MFRTEITSYVSYVHVGFLTSNILARVTIKLRFFLNSHFLLSARLLPPCVLRIASLSSSPPIISNCCNFLLFSLTSRLAFSLAPLKKKEGASVPFLPCWFHSFFDYPVWQVFFSFFYFLWSLPANLFQRGYAGCFFTVWDLDFGLNSPSLVWFSR